jgi:hypothetical protein
MKPLHESDTGRSRLSRIKDEAVRSKEKRLLPAAVVSAKRLFPQGIFREPCRLLAGLQCRWGDNAAWRRAD